MRLAVRARDGQRRALASQRRRLERDRRPSSTIRPFTVVEPGAPTLKSAAFVPEIANGVASVTVTAALLAMVIVAPAVEPRAMEPKSIGAGDTVSAGVMTLARFCGALGAMSWKSLALSFGIDTAAVGAARLSFVAVILVGCGEAGQRRALAVRRACTQAHLVDDGRPSGSAIATPPSSVNAGAGKSGRRWRQARRPRS